MILGHIIYLDFNEYKEYEFDKSDLNPKYGQVLSSIIMQKINPDGSIKIKFDCVETSDYDGGYLIGFLYPDKKYCGNFHYKADTGNPEKEVFNGVYIEKDGGYEIKGWVDAGNSPRYGFFFKIWNSDLTDTGSKKNNMIRKKKISKKIEIDTFQNVLNKDLLEQLIKKSTIQKASNLKGKYNLYNHITKMNPQPDSINNLILAMSVAYSWMPTMLDVYLNDKKELNTALRIVNYIGTINTLNDFDSNLVKIEKGLIKLTSIINNSIVGTSKVLHIFFPNTIPILDSNVLLGWNKCIERQFKKYPELKLTINVPTTLNRRVSLYMKYWRLLLMFKQNVKQRNIRVIEEPLYWIGSKSKRKIKAHIPPTQF